MSPCDGTAEMRFGRWNYVRARVGDQCPLWIALRTQVGHLPGSELCQKATYAAQQNDAHVLGYSISSSASKLCVDLSDQGAAVEIIKQHDSGLRCAPVARPCLRPGLIELLKKT